MLKNTKTKFLNLQNSPQILQKILFAIVLAILIVAIPAAADTGCQIYLGNGEWASDYDCDKVEDGLDNCPFDYNPTQSDFDNDGLGDACDSDEPDDNEAPEFIHNIEDQTIWAGEDFETFDLDYYVDDPDNADYELVFDYEGNDRLSVHIGSNHVVHINYPDYFSGDEISEVITFIVEDPEGERDYDSARFTVRKKETPENQPPRFTSGINGQSVDCNQEFSKIYLREFVEDPDDSIYDLTFDYESMHNAFDVSITSSGVVYIYHDNEDAQDYITFIVEDPHGATAESNTALFRVTCDNPVEGPTISGIPDQSICNDEEFDSFDLDAYTDFDGDWDDLEFSVSGDDDLDVEITSSHRVYIDYPSNFEGSETLVFRVEDTTTGDYDTDSAVFRVRDCSGPEYDLEINGIPDQTIWEDEEFDIFDLDNYVDFDGDWDDLEFTVSGFEDLDVDITSSHQVHIDYPTNFVGSETLTFKVIDTTTGDYDTDSAVFRVREKEDDDDEEENERPRWKNIPDQIIHYGENFDEFDLDYYAYDPDNDDDELEYWVENDDDLDVDIDSRNRVEVDYPRGFCGYERIKFVVEDPEGEQATEAVTFKVLCDDDDYWYVPPPLPPVPPFGPVPIDGGCSVKDTYTGRVLNDYDCDTVPDEMDNCPTVKNQNQLDSNSNGLGNVCDLNLVSFTITPSTELGSGQAFVPEIVLRNLAEESIENINVEVSIPELNIRHNKVIELESGESQTLNLFLRIPECTPEQTLNAKLTINYNVRDVLTKSQKITVIDGRCIFDKKEPLSIVDMYSIQDVPLGKSAVYPFQITNDADSDRSYVLAAEGVSSWGSYYFDSGAVVVIPKGVTKTVNLYVTANKDAVPGERSFAVNVKTGPESQELILVANLVQEEKESSYAWLITFLEIVLAVLIVFGIVYGINVVAKLKSEHDKEKIVKEVNTDSDEIRYYH